MSTVVDLGGSKLSGTGAPLFQCKGVELAEGESEDFGDVLSAQCLGVSSRPYPADEDGNAQGFVLDDVPGADGVAVGGWDPRSAGVIAELGPGETCLHSTGKDYDSRAFCKDQLFAIVVGDDCVLSIDRKNKKIIITGFGHAFQIDESGISISDKGGATIKISGGVISLMGTVVLGGMVPFAPVHAGPGAGPTSVPAPGVFVGK